MLCVLGTEGGRFAQCWEDPSVRAYSPLIPQIPMKGWSECPLTTGQFFWDRTGAIHSCHRASSPQSCQQGWSSEKVATESNCLHLCAGLGLTQLEGDSMARGSCPSWPHSPTPQVLIPVFALGRAQELCILLETFW